jgi:hypothetical protein
MKTLFKNIFLVIFFILNIFIYNSFNFNPKFELIINLCCIFFIFIFIWYFIKPHFMNYINYLITIIILIFFLLTIIFNCFYIVKNIRDLTTPVSTNAVVCSKALKEQYKWTDGSKQYVYLYYFCDEKDKIITKTIFPYDSDVTNKVWLNSKLSITYYKGSKIIKYIKLNDLTASTSYDKWYLLFIIFLSYFYIYLINKSNIQIIEVKVLSEEEEYILFMLGKKKKVTDKPKNILEKIKDKFKKDNTNIK